MYADLRSADQRSAAYLEAVFEAAVDAVVVSDQRGTIEMANAAVRHIFGWEPERLVGQNVSVLMAGRDRAAHARHMQSYVSGGKAARIVGIGREVTAVRSDGTPLPVLLSIAEAEIDGSRHFVAVLHDLSDLTEIRAAIEELQRERDLLEQRVSIDPLTGLKNRAHMESVLAAERESGHPQRPPGVVVMIDIDHFKAINDRLGHPAGDAVLQAVAGRLADAIRRQDEICRWGGEEFCLLLRGLPDAAAIRSRAEELRQSICSRAIAIDNARVEVTVSVGAACDDDPARDPVARADVALYEAKRAGRNRVRLAGQAAGQADTPRV